MPFSGRAVDPARPPADLDALIDWFEEFSYELVLLEEFSLEEIRAALDAFEREVRRHVDANPPAPRGPPAGRDPAERAAILASDHAWFRTSLDQLEWFYAVVARDDHGGNRQALGQYGRVFSEALRRHRSDERSDRPPGPGRERPSISRALSGNRN